MNFEEGGRWTNGAMGLVEEDPGAEPPEQGN